MFPVMAEHEVQVIQQARQERLAAADRARLIRSLAASSSPSAPKRRSPPRAWTALSAATRGLSHGLIRSSGPRPITMGDKTAATRS